MKRVSLSVEWESGGVPKVQNVGYPNTDVILYHSIVTL